MALGRVVRGVAVAVVLVGAVVVGSTAAPAGACSCAVATDEASFGRADVVFTGRLVDDRSADAVGARSSGDPRWLTFAVDRVFKGDAAARQPVVTVLEVASCGVEVDGPGPYLVFADRDVRGGQDDRGRQGAGGQLATDLCSGTRTLAVAQLPAALGEGRPPAPGDGDQAGVAWPPEDTSWWPDAGRGRVVAVTSVVLGLVTVGLAVVAVRRRRRTADEGGGADGTSPTDHATGTTGTTGTGRTDHATGTGTGRTDHATGTTATSRTDHATGTNATGEAGGRVTG